MPVPTALPTQASTALAASGVDSTISRARRKVRLPSAAIAALTVRAGGIQAARRRARIALSSRARGSVRAFRSQPSIAYSALPR